MADAERRVPTVERAHGGSRLVDVVTIRPAVADDGEFLQHMLVVAADWRPEATPRPVEKMLRDPALAHYVVGWPQSGDFGVVAEEDGGRRLGAAWCRYFSADDPSYGFVSPDVPEVSIGVLREARGHGVGRGLMEALIEEARVRSISDVSLSVEVDNFARHLYTRLGFTVVDEVGGAATMILALD